MEKTTVRKGETINLAFDWSRVAKKNATSVSSATWSTDSSNVSLGSATLSANVSTVPVTNSATQGGQVTLTNTATMADGQVFVRKLWVELVDHTAVGYTVDRYR